MSKPYIQKYLILSLGMILFLTGAAKVWSSLGHAQVLDEFDPIFGLTFHLLFRVVGIVELGLACYCWRSCRGLNTKSIRLAGILVAWFSTLLVGYRLGLLYVHWSLPCRCLGDFTEALHIPRNVAENMMKAILCYMFFGSYGLLIWQWKMRLLDYKPTKQ
jgi:hypothetical protein